MAKPQDLWKLGLDHPDFVHLLAAELDRTGIKGRDTLVDEWLSALI
jgi:hypothetical protein